MRKSQLKKIEIQPWKPGQVSTCATNQYMVTCQKMESGVIFAFYRFQTEGYEHTPYAVMFCEEYDFTTYFPGADWWSDSSVFSASNEAKGSLSDTFSGLYYGWKTPEAKTIFASVKDKKTAESFLGHYHDKPVNDYLSDYQVSKLPAPWDSFIRYQSHILELRKNKRHRKANEKREKLFSMLREPGPGFANWVKDKALSKFQYGFYTPKGSTKVLLECSVCQGSEMISKRQIKGFGRKQLGFCPFCGKAVTFLPKAIQKGYWIESKHVSIMQKTSDGGFVFRDYVAKRTFRKETLPAHEDNLSESSRWFVNDTSNTGYLLENGWRERRDGWFYPQMLYPRTVSTAVKGTKYEKCGITELARNGWEQRYSLYLWNVVKYPVLEKLAKAGFDAAIQANPMDVFYPLMNLNASDLYGALKLSREQVRRIRRLGLTDNTSAIELFQKAYVSDMYLQDEDIAEILDSELRRGDTNTFLTIMRKTGMTAHKILRYLNAQKGRYKTKVNYYSTPFDDALSTYSDHIRMLEYLGYDLKDQGVTLHPNLKVAHDRISEEYNTRIDAEKKEKQRIHDAEMLKLMTSISDQLSEDKRIAEIMQTQSDGLFIKVLMTPELLREEGKALHNCIGSYIDRVARGETMIFAIRKIEEPEKAFCAFEYRNGKIIQIRADHNSDAPDNVIQFADYFAKRMQKVRPLPAPAAAAAAAA